MNFFTKLYLKLLNKFKAEVTPPTYERKREIIDYYRKQYKLNVLVETGTFFGDTVFYFKNIFEKIYSIELVEDLAQRAKKRFVDDKNVIIIQGDSGVEVNKILHKEREPILFWLDGHYSSEFMCNGELIKTGRTDKDTPIEMELESILSDNINHIILIDDARGFTGLGDYPTISNIKSKLYKYKKKTYTCIVNEDIIRLLPQNNNLI